MKVGTALSILAQPGRPDVALYNEHMALGDLAEPLGFDSLFALEHHFTELPYWSDIVVSTGGDVGNPVIQNGFIPVPEAPGLGIDLNEAVVREHMLPGEEYFGPSTQWDDDRSWDRLWS